MQQGMVLGTDEGQMVWLRGLGVRFLIDGQQTGGQFSLVEHVLQPRALGSPLHTHQDEDEISYVVEGEVGVQIGERVEIARPGAVVFKPRGIPHAFWNPGDTTARFLEVITPAGFEGYFSEAAQIFAGDGPPDIDRLLALLGQYRLTMELESIPRLVQEHGLAGA
ncbi:MAG: cupin domain-containing protein [Chloroflexota bacterium]|nr:cupin domain-containing protein [Chloroflexota bacterium]